MVLMFNCWSAVSKICKVGLNRMLKILSVNLVRSSIHIAFILTLFIIPTIQPTFAGVTNTSQSIGIPPETLQQKKVIKVEYSIDELPVTDSEILSTLKNNTYIEAGSQFSRHAIQRSIIALYSLQQYSKVDVYSVETDDGVALKFDLIKMMHIQKIKISDLQSDELTIAIRSVIRLEPGRLYLPEIAESYISSIKAVCADYGFFDANVEIDVISSEGVLTYQVSLGKSTLINKIQIFGNTTIFTERIREVCQTDVGKIYRRSTVDADIEAIRRLYREKYFPSTKIIPEFEDQTGVLTFKIEEGIQLLLDFVDEGGNPIIKDTPIRDFLGKLSIIRHQSEKDQLRDAITSLINNQSRWEQTVANHFEAKGYDGTKVKAKRLTNSPLHVKFTIDLGIRYKVTRVTFAGNTAFTEKELLREMDTKPVRSYSRFFQQPIFSQRSLARDIQRLVVLYMNGGYPDVEVKKPELEKQVLKNRETGEVSIHLTIVENHKEVINRVQIKGNSVLNSSTLLDALSSEPPIPNASLVQKKYENAILRTYQNRGYGDAKVEKAEYLHKMVTPAFQVDGYFSEQLDSGVIPKILRDAFKEHGLSLTGTNIATNGEEWNLQDVDGNARYTLKQEQDYVLVYEHGVLQFEIDEGDQVAFGNFFFPGDTGVTPNVLKREVDHLQASIYTPEKLNRVIQNLNSMGIFEPGIRPQLKKPTDIDIHPIVKDVSIPLQKQKPRAIGATVGYSTSDGPRGTISFSHFNLFSRNVRFRLRGRGGTRGYLYDTTLTEPWLLGRTSGSLNFLGRKLEEDDDVRALQGGISLSRKLSRIHRLNLEYSFRDLKDTSIITAIRNPSTTVSSIRFLWRQDSRVPSLNPITGMLNEVTVEYAGGYLGGKSSFIKMITDTRHYQSLNERGFVLATALRLGVTTGLLGSSTVQQEDDRETDNGEELISFERFWAGGSTTVRGYEERGLGPEDITGKHRGNVQLIFNTELRFPIFEPIQGILFFDTGNVWGTIEDVEYKWMPSSVGVGLRLNLGPLVGGIDYAVPLLSVPDVPIDTFYIRVGSTF